MSLKRPPKNRLFYNPLKKSAMEKTVRIFLTMKEKFSPVDLVLMAPSVFVILHGFIR